MAMPDSSVSKIGAYVREFLKGKMDASTNHIDIKIGTPADAANTSTSNNVVNLFFYRFDTSGFEAALRPGEIRHIRMYCLITPFGKDDDAEHISAGENDLRMLGNIMRIFHENPIINDSELYLHVIFLPLSDEQINQVWSTQGETTYRPSVVYEMSLALIVPGVLWGGAPLVGALGTQLAGMSARHTRFSDVTAAAPPVVKSTVNLADPAWIPKICFIYNGQCVQSLSLNVDNSDFSSFEPQVWIAGDSSKSVNLVWEVWEKPGWSKAGPPILVHPFNTDIDPDDIPKSSGFPLSINLPSTLTLTGGEFSKQALLYATRSIVGQPSEIKSNPLLVNVYRNR